MMNCTAIELLDIPQWMPDEFLIEGRLFLDLNQGTKSLSQGKKAEELSDINKIRTDIVIGFELPHSSRNDAALGHMVNPNTWNRPKGGLRVRAWQGSSVLKQNLLYVMGDDDTGKAFNVELRFSKDHWLIKAADTKLCDLKGLGTWEFSEANLLDIQYNNAKYEDGDPGIYAPLANYGKRHRSGRIIPEDFRILFHALFLLQKGFCQIGYTFRSPILESEYGRKMGVYALNKTLGPPVDNLRFKANRLAEEKIFPANLPPTRTLIFDNEIEDPGGRYDPATGEYVGSVYARFYALIDFKIDNGITPGGNDDIRVQFTFWIIHLSDGVESVLNEQTIQFTLEPGIRFQTITLISDYAAVSSSDKVFVRQSRAQLLGNITFTRANIIIQPSSAFYCEPKANYYSEGDIINLAQTLSCEIDLLSLAKGVSHYCRGLFDTDRARKTITMYQPETVNVHEEEVEGYYQDEVIDLTGIVQPGSRKTITEQQEIERFISLRFKKGSDQAVSDLKLPEEEPLFSRRIDLGDRFLDSTKTYENPLFEPTLNKEMKGVGSVSGFGPCVPHMIDNSNNDLSFDIGPRLLHFHGMELIKNEETDTAVSYMYKDESRFLYPLAYQQMEGFVHFFETTPLNKVIMYGYNEHDAYNLFWKPWLRSQFSSIKLEFLVGLDLNTFNLYSLRKKYVFNYNGLFVNARISEVRDFKGCEDLRTPVLFLPKTFGEDLCILDDDGEDPIACFAATQRLYLVVTQVGNCYNFNIEGSTSLFITSILYEWRYFDEDIWTTATSLCDPERRFIVRATITFEEDCPPLVKTKTVDPCSETQAHFNFSYDYTTNCVSVLVVINPDVVDSIMMEYSLDGETYEEYTTAICGFFGEICFRATINFNNGCEPLILEECFSIPPDGQQDCGNIDASIECSYNLEGGVIPIRIGNVDPTNILLDLIRYRYGTGDEWKLWDETTPLNCPVILMRVIIFCNNECPPYCSEIVVCDECEDAPICDEISAGEPENLTVCN